MLIRSSAETRKIEIRDAKTQGGQCDSKRDRERERERVGGRETARVIVAGASVTFDPISAHQKALPLSLSLSLSLVAPNLLPRAQMGFSD